ncbi:MAG: GIY-YIG nuclease family protein [Anaerolineales bacterium]
MSEENNAQCYCYIVKCADETFYTGWTTDVHRRVGEHNAGRGAFYTKWRRPVELIYVEEYPDRSAAMSREYEIKQLSHQQKKALSQTYETEAETDEIPCDG